jgi:hypothetical protein
LHQVSGEFFVNAVHGYLKNNQFVPIYREWYPLTSKTNIYFLGKIKKEILEKMPRTSSLAVGAIKKEEFHELCGFNYAQPNPFGDEYGWFTDESNSFLGVIIQDKIDKDWGYVILARDNFFEFRAIETKINFPKREGAVASLQIKIAKLLEHGKRIFGQ